MANNSNPSAVLSELMRASLSKNPALASKQQRLLQKISEGSNSKQPGVSNGSEPGAQPTLPAQPKRK
jgi:hypothetical protein